MKNLLNKGTSRGLVAAIGLVVLLASACGSSESEDPVASSSAAAPTAEVVEAEPAEEPEAAEAATVEVGPIAAEVAAELVAGNTEIIADAFSSDFVNHATGETGIAALTSSVEEQAAAYPDAETEIYRVVTDGEMVFVHANLILEPDTLGFATADIYRFVDGKIAEQWSGIQEVPETTASGNDMFSTLSSPQRLSPDPDSSAEETQAVVGALGAALVVDKDLTAWDRLVEPPYYQHSINTPNGVEAVKEIWGALLIDPDVVITPLNGFAEGDLSVSQNLIEGPGLNLMTFDISRVVDGKIVEHWDVVQDLS